ncbi:ATP synthase subunit I [Alteromonas facilis]|uniref:ATP synthase subunit I n=1 Tax=Alteromonas facilis TaxID=2048004 RepID=UPI000C28B144|nr:ATP synthase subunit I [Alteromonas facilis]
MPSIDLVEGGKKLAKYGFFTQIIVTLAMVVIAATVFSIDAAVSVALGSAASIIPNGIFAFFAFRFSGAQRSQAVAKNLMQGARYKLGLAAIIFGIAFIAFEAQPLLLFCAFAITTISYWLTMIRFSAAA